MAYNMANETSALRGETQPAQVPAHVAEDDYRSFSAALGESARGRAFLHEYARRNRHADTEVVLAALERLESAARIHKTAPEAERIRQDLRALLDTIRSARPQIDQTPGAIKAATLAALIEFVQARIEALVQPNHAPLASVPEPEQPELPIPQPGTAAQRTIALVEAIAPPPSPVAREAQGSVVRLDARVTPAERNFDPDAMLSELPRPSKIIPEVNFIDSLFSAIDAKNKTEGKAGNAENLITAATPSEPVIAAAPVVALLPVEAPAAKLPIDMPGPVAGAPLAAIEDTAGDTNAATTESVARPDATVAKINASAAAIDEIVAAAQAAMADAASAEAAQAGDAIGDPALIKEAVIETGFVETAFVEAAIAETASIEAAGVETAGAKAEFVETIFAEAAKAETELSETELFETGFVEATFPEATLPEATLPETTIADAVPMAIATKTPLGNPLEAQSDIQPAAAEPTALAPIDAVAANRSMQAMNNALTEIMALSDEERLALFT